MCSKNIEKILLKSRKNIFGDMLGNNLSPIHGEGFEFAELREYIYGDDIRKINWKVTAKTRKPFVNIYMEERTINVVTAVMMGGSTYFGTVKQKKEAIAELVGNIGFSAIKNSDPFSNIIFADKLYSITKPSRRFFAVKNAINEICNFDMLGKQSGYKELMDTLYRRIKKRSLIFVIADFVGDINISLLSKKHEVVVIIVRDKFEENPQELGYLRVLDMETSVSFEGTIGEKEIKEYKKALEENDKKLYLHLKKNGVRYRKIVDLKVEN